MRPFDRSTLTRPLILTAALAGCAPSGPPPAAPSADAPVAEQAAPLAAAGTRLVSADARHLEFVVEVPEARFSTVETPFGRFDRLDVDPLARPGGPAELGEPEVPVATVRFGVPVDGAIERIEIRPEGARVFEGVRLYPIQDDRQRREAGFAFDEARYAAPVQAIEPRSIAVGRGVDMNVARMRINLGDYDADALRLTMYRQMRIRIALRGHCLVLGDPTPTDPLGRAIGGPADPRLGGLLNAQAMVAHACVDAAPDPVDEPVAPRTDLLIVTDPAYATAAHTLAAHKRRLGLRTAVVETTDAGADVDEIHAYLHGVRDPRYLLLLGDADDIAPRADAELGDGCLEATGDVFAGQPEDDPNAIPAMGIGRLPARSQVQAEAMVDRIIDYELDPSPADDFYEAFSVAAEWEDDDADGTMDRGYVHTAEHIAQGLEALGMQVDRHFGTFSTATPARWASDDVLPWWLRAAAHDWTASRWALAGDVVDGLTDGRLVALHRGHGSPTAWSMPRLQSTHADDPAIVDNEFPFIVSINCDTGRFDREVLSAAVQSGASCSPSDTVLPSFAEAFLDESAIGVFAATRVTRTASNHAVARGVYEALYPAGWYAQRMTERADGTRTLHQAPLEPWRAPVRRLGDVANAGRAAAADAGLSDDATARQVLVYNLLGDPTVRLRTMAPVDIEPSVEVTRRALRVTLPLQTLAVATLTDPETGALLARAAADGDRIELPIDRVRGAVDLTVSGPDLRPTVQRLRF